MKSIIIPVILTLILSACGSSRKKTIRQGRPHVTVEAGTKENAVEPAVLNHPISGDASDEMADQIIHTALTYTGVRYKFGGTSRQGLDCSGLLYLAFGEHDFQLPRISYQMAEEGKSIHVNRVEKGDLLFFKTTKKAKKINHVGLVVAVEGDEIRFIHSTSSRGVIVSSLREGYWNYAFVKATRVF